MTTNPTLGVLLHAIGGRAAGSFYAPLKKVRRWAWKSYWLVVGLAAWLVALWVVAFYTTPKLSEVLSASPAKAWLLCILFGLLWGLGNLTFGLSVRYLGMAGVLRACFAFGLAASKPIADLSIEHGTAPLYSNNAVLVVILTGVLASNATWCLILNAKNKSFKDYVCGTASQQTINYFLSLLAGAVWYCQFFFYEMGTPNWASNLFFQPGRSTWRSSSSSAIYGESPFMNGVGRVGEPGRWSGPAFLY